MKKIGILLSLVLFSLNAFGGQPDGTPSEKVAREAAFLHASDTVFVEILDHGSSVNVLNRYEDQSGYVFVAIADLGAKFCVVDVTVSKETGLAFNDEPMVCEQKR